MSKTKKNTTHVSLTLSKEERLRQRAAQIAFNNSPESAKIDQECLEMLKRGQQEEKAIRKKYGLK